MADRETGTVKWFSDSKGFGFIERAGGSDVFVHHTAIRGEGYRSLSDGQQVEFSVVQGQKGPAAEDVAVDMASPEDLILSKLQWARRAQSERQCRDARGVLEAQRDALDFGYLGKWAAELGVQDLLGRLLHEIGEERR